jgi:hypothetical protein
MHLLVFYKDIYQNARSNHQDREDCSLWIIQSYSLAYPADFTEFQHEGVEEERGGGVLEAQIQRYHFVSRRRDLVVGLYGTGNRSCICVL